MIQPKPYGMSTILETERLRLRKFNYSDASFIVELTNSLGWLAYIGDRNIRTKEDAINYIMNGPLKSYATHGFGLSAVELKTSGELIGMCGLLKRDYLNHPDIGFAFLPDYMGQGYAFEIVSATMNYATEMLAIPTILATVLPANEKSIRLLQKIGLTFSKTFVSPTDGVELLLYSS